MSETQFIEDWNAHAEAVEAGLLTTRRSSRIGLMSRLHASSSPGQPRTVELRLDIAPPTSGTRLSALDLTPSDHPQRPFTLLATGSGRAIEETSLQLAPGAQNEHVFDGLRLKVADRKHRVQFNIVGGNFCSSKIILALESVALAPVLAESSLLRSAQRNMTADEVMREGGNFSASWGAPIEVANAAAGATLELFYENAQPGRDAMWQATLRITDRYLDAGADVRAVTHVTHAPFMVAQVLAPRFEPEAGSILAQWNSNDPDGAQWRFAVDTVALTMMTQSVGEAMVRGNRFSSDGKAGVDPLSPVDSRFARSTDITVRPSRRVRRYTVHPGDILSTLQDAELETLVTEMAYPLEVTYRRTAQSKRTVLVSELQRWLGTPVISLPAVDDWKGTPGTPMAAALEESMSATLARWFVSGPVPQATLRTVYETLRTRHLANRASCANRVAQFPLSDAAFADGRLDLDQDLSARLRSQAEGAAPIYPVPLDVALSPSAMVALHAFAPDPDTGLAGVTAARDLPVGLLNTIEFASELLGVLATPVTAEVKLFSLSLSALGASGAMKAAFDEGRTIFDVECTDGQQSRLVKTRIGRIGVAWNRAIHVVVYQRSTVPGAQFEGEQLPLVGRPLLRKMEEYIEITEPQRRFMSELEAMERPLACIHSFGFATLRIYVNSAWGRDLGDEVGYEIPLFNETDQSGFYSKPWLGPVAESGADSLVHHWHDHPQDMVFYSNGKRGAGADSDAWAALSGLDCDDKVCFGTVATGERVKPNECMPHKTVPSYNLAAADNPRFAMRVKADGPSNLAHGRGPDKLLGQLRTIHLERTAAASRLRFNEAGPLASLMAGVKTKSDAVWESAKGAAEVRTIEATIARITRDALALRDAMGTAQELLQGCATFKQRLVAQVEASFGEAKTRLDEAAPLIGKVDVPAIVSQQRDRLDQFLTEKTRLPWSILQAACREAEQSLVDARTTLGAMGGQAQAGTLALATRLQDSWDGIALHGVIARAAGALEEPALAVQQGCGQLKRSQQAIAAAIAQASAKFDLELAALQALIDGDEAALATAAQTWLTKLAANAPATLVSLDDAAAAVRKVVLPESLKSLRSTQADCIEAIAAACGGLGQAFRHAATVLQEINDGTAAGAAEIKLRLIALRDSVQVWCTAAKAAGGALAPAIVVIQAQLEKPLAPLTALRIALQGALPDPAPALQALVDAAGANGAIQAERIALDTMLAALQVQVRSEGDNAGVVLMAALRGLCRQAQDALAPALDTLETELVARQDQARNALVGATAVLGQRLAQARQEILASISLLDCGAWDKLRGDLERQTGALVEDVRRQVASGAAALFDEETRHRVDALKDEVATVVERGDRVLQDAYEAVAPKAGQAIKMMRLLSDPPELPQITINTDKLDCVFDDVARQIETSPFVARLREIAPGLKELGIAIPSRALVDQMVLDSVEGLVFSEVFKNIAADFEEFFKKFRLPDMPTGAVKFSHHIDQKTRSASGKAEIQHQFDSTEQLFDIATFSLDIRKPRIDASANFMLAADAAGKAQTSAKFGGDWILNFEGQPLVTFQGANVQYSDSGGFKFDLDPAKILPHPALLFLSTILKAKTPKLPEGVKLLRDEQGRPTGASIEQKDTIGPYDVGPLFIGETVLATRFALQFISGRMHIDASFGIGDVASPVFMQIGIYGGGGWVKGRAWLEQIDDRLVPAYSASIGVSLGSARAFTLASVATGSYAIRIFVQATFASLGGNSFTAGLSVSGSARILGYLNAYLLLLLQAEHKDGGDMQGSGQLDVEIEVCWCYSVRVSRSVEQNM
ncbi:hypothetical protein [Janthinobacterium sp. PSPC3-1]|uniref:hypothetical protein n=1 Tax=Janthinobacterium sp. PSPC3-1 TaxID=2804653 RepID=UPI003CE81CD5